MNIVRNAKRGLSGTHIGTPRRFVLIVSVLSFPALFTGEWWRYVAVWALWASIFLLRGWEEGAYRERQETEGGEEQ